MIELLSWVAFAAMSLASVIVLVKYTIYVLEPEQEESHIGVKLLGYAQIITVWAMSGLLFIAVLNLLRLVLACLS